MLQNINKELAHIFEEMGIIYEIKEEKFRQRAYHRAALIMDNLARDAKNIYEKGGINSIKELSGIGEGLAKKIEEYIKTEHIREYEKLKKDVPVELEQLTSVEGVGPKAIKTFYKEFGVKNLKDLEKVAKAGKIQKLEGFGKKTEENILQSIEFLKQNSGRQCLGDMLPYARSLIEEIEKIDGVVRVSEAGSLRRRKETIGDVDILVTAKNNKKVLEYIERLPGVVKIWGRGSTKISVHLKQGFDVDVRVVGKESYGAALQYFTGSKEHNVKVRQIAIEKGYKLNEYGLFEGKKNLASGVDECDIYKKLGMQCPPPEIRQNGGEIQVSKENKLPKLIQYGSLKGDLQIQTNWTDGAHSVEEMALWAKKYGLEYIAITDHTKNLAITGGLNEEKLLKQIKEIKKLNSKINDFTILSGSEVDILKDGSLDISDEVLSQLDVVGISVHSYFNLDRSEQTERVIKAIKNPNADILFHPTGRRINKRPPIALDMELVIKTAYETGTILEINAHPDRLDLKDKHIRMAVDVGVKMTINSDAHSKDGFSVLEYGVAQARRGWATASDVINTLPVEEFLKKLKNNR